MTVWKRGSWASKLSFFPAPCWISRPAVSGSVPGLPWGFPPSQPSGESSLHAERQQFDSQVLVGHRASHTFMSESSCRMVKKKKSLSSSSCISALILSPSLLKHWHSWLILDDYSRCTKSQGQFFFFTWFMNAVRWSQRDNIIFTPCVTFFRFQHCFNILLACFTKREKGQCTVLSEYNS